MMSLQRIRCISSENDLQSFSEDMQRILCLRHTYLAASALLLLLPQTSLLFQGQEWGSSSPFLFFTDHNPDLGKLVTEGRRKEFAGFSGFNDAKLREKIPDPQELSTFQSSQLNHEEKSQPGHQEILTFYKELIKYAIARKLIDQGCDINWVGQRNKIARCP